MIWKAAAPWLKESHDKDGDLECSMDWRFATFKEDIYYASEDEAELAITLHLSEQSSIQGFAKVYFLQIALYDSKMDCGRAGLALTRDEKTGKYQRIGIYIYDPAGMEGRDNDGFPRPRNAKFYERMKEEQRRRLRDIEPSEITII